MYNVCNSKKTDDRKIINPIIGQARVAKYDEDDLQWHRANIIGLPSPQDVDISYVDINNDVTFKSPED